MVKAQVRIPDELFEKAKRIAAEKGWSISEIVCRGLEEMVARNSEERKRSGEWKSPRSYNMGEPLVPEEEWTIIAHDL